MWNASLVSAPPATLPYERAPRAPRVRRGLHDEHDGALAEHEAVAVGVERAARALRCVVAQREGTHVGQAGEHRLRDPGVRAARDDDVGLAGHDQPAGLQERVVAARAGEGARRDGAVGAQVDGDLARGHVRDRGRHEVRAHVARAAGPQRLDVALGLRHARHGAVDDDAQPVAGGRDVDACVRDGLAGRADRELAEARRAPRALGTEQRLGIEPAHLAGDADGESRRVEVRDRADARAPGDEAVPRGRGVEAERRDRTQARDDDVVDHGRSSSPSSASRRACSRTW